MGIYLPTISFLIKPEEIPKIQLETYNDIIPLLEKYHKKFYQCTTRGYYHLALLSRIVADFKLPKIDFYQKGCSVAFKDECTTLYQSLKRIEQFVLNNDSQIVDNLIEEEKRTWEMIYNREMLFKRDKPNEITKENYRKKSIQRITELTNFSFAKYYAEAEINRDISEYDETSQYGDNKYKIVLIWLKVQIFILNKAITDKKALIHVVITP
jgi:hypothetical protein